MLIVWKVPGTALIAIYIYNKTYMHIHTFISHNNPVSGNY